MFACDWFGYLIIRPTVTLNVSITYSDVREQIGFDFDFIRYNNVYKQYENSQKCHQLLINNIIAFMAHQRGNEQSATSDTDGWPRKIFQSWRGDDNLCELWKYLNIISIFAFFNYCIQNSIQLSVTRRDKDHNIQLMCSQQHHNLLMYVRATTSYHTYLSDNRSAWYYRNRNKKNNLMTKNLSGAGEQGIFNYMCSSPQSHRMQLWCVLSTHLMYAETP